VQILYVSSPIYDYLTATVLEGLGALGHEVRTTEQSNYGLALPDVEVREYAASADLIVVGSNVGVRTELLHGVANPRLVYVDGTDHQTIAAPAGLAVAGVFKRELCPRDPAAGHPQVAPLPFAAEQRYFAEARRRDVAVSFLCNVFTNPLRASVYHRLVARGRPDVLAGATGERAYDPAHPRGLPVETPMYRDVLHRSQISVNVPGAGYDCARYWEILAAGAMLLTYTPDIVIPHGFTDGVDCVTFDSLPELEAKLDFYLDRPDEVATIAAAGHQRLLRHHTTAARAAWFLEQAGRMLELSGARAA
jgi:hypothetical protein